MSHPLLYIVAGILGVSNMILWGVYGDLLIEPFSLKKVLRSLTLGLIYAVYLYWVNSQLPLILVALIVIAFERVTTEIYKALIRDERQIKYKIPSDLNIDFPRWIEKTVGFASIISIALMFKFMTINISLMLLFIIAVFVPAFGGMMKDAPYEGFYPFKFLRSPIVVLFVGYFLLRFFPSYEQKYLLFAAWGGERVLSECYKKILHGNIPGKFKRGIHRHIHHSWKVHRRYVLTPYILTLLLIVCLAFYPTV